MIDLHCHSYYSDGLLSPEALLQLALDADIKCLALTDHDTCDGLERLHVAAKGKPITIINGIELSVQWKKHDIHILGLDINPENLNLVIEQQKTQRIDRAKSIGLLLKACGVDNAYEKACEVAGHNRVGRPHFAAVLLQEGVVSDIQMAFKRYLGRGKPAYVSSNWINLTEAVQAIVNAGGVAVIAHPLKYKLTRTKLHELLKAFKMDGGAGIEVVSSETMPSDAQTLAGLCSRFELLASTGSDYHGTGLSRVPLGRQMQLPSQCTPIWHTWKGVRGHGVDFCNTSG